MLGLSLTHTGGRVHCLCWPLDAWIHGELCVTPYCSVGCCVDLLPWITQNLLLPCAPGRLLPSPAAVQWPVTGQRCSRWCYLPPGSRHTWRLYRGRLPAKSPAHSPHVIGLLTHTMGRGHTSLDCFLDQARWVPAVGHSNAPQVDLHAMLHLGNPECPSIHAKGEAAWAWGWLSIWSRCLLCPPCVKVLLGWQSLAAAHSAEH